jgi:serine/threonine protein kinase
MTEVRFPLTHAGCFQLSDFGLAVADGAKNNNNIKLSGTLGYVAPEYLLDGMLMPTKLEIIANCIL